MLLLLLQQLLLLHDERLLLLLRDLGRLHLLLRRLVQMKGEVGSGHGVRASRGERGLGTLSRRQCRGQGQQWSSCRR